MSSVRAAFCGGVIAIALLVAHTDARAQRNAVNRCTTLTLEDESPLTPASTRRPRELLVFESAWVSAPLDASEHAAVVEAVRQAMARATGLGAITQTQTDAIVREAKRGRALGRESCAAPLTLSDALEDARPDALIAEVYLTCDEVACAVNVEVIGANVVEPASVSRLHALVTGVPHDVRAWLDAVATLALPTHSAPLMLYAFSAPGSSVRRADTYGEGLAEDTLRMKLERILPELTGCAPSLRLSFAAVLDVEADGDVRVAHRTDAEVEGAACREAALRALRFDAAEGRRRAIIAAALNEPGATESTAETQGPVRFGAYAVSDPRLEADDAMTSITRAMATCDTARATRPTPLAASIRLAVGGDGRATRATVTTDDTAVRRCLEREIMQIT